MKLICKNCNKIFESRNSTKQHCSKECFSEYRNRPEVLQKTIEKRKLSNLKKYGVDNASKLNIIKEKTKQTCLNKYGVISPTLVKEIHNKQKQTCIEKYGKENAMQSDEIKQKVKNIFIKKYGVSVPLKDKNIKQKLIQTNLKKYGVSVSSKSSVVKEKRKQTCLKLYNSTSAMGNYKLKQKCIENRWKNHYDNIICNSEKFNNIIPLFKQTDYKGNGESYSSKYPFLCKVCNNKFEDTLISGHIPKCSICYPPKQSKPQEELYEYIKLILPNEIIQKNIRNVIPPQELDIYIPSLKIAIEFNGLYWHSEISGKKNKTFHINKTNKCKENGIRLIHIFEDEWFDKKEIVKNKLKHIFGLNITEKIYARNCIIKEIPSNESNKFLETNHIQGDDNSSIRIGLFYKNELTGVMTFGKLRIALGNKSKQDEYEMYRFATSKNVIGAGGKLIKYFINTYNPDKIISYADYRWSNDNAFYKKIGFSLTQHTSPNYWYIPNNYNIRIYRYNFVKHKLKNILKKFDNKLTEWQNMQLNGYDRIWDCGHLKYEWIKQ